MSGYKSRPEALGLAIAEFLKRSGLSRQMGPEKFTEMWEEVAGKELAKRTRVVGGVRSGVLVIEVDSPGLLGELKGFREEELLSGMRERHKRKYIRKLNFVLGSWEK